MRYEQTQIGKLIEQVKLAILSNTPIVYIPTQQIEVIQNMLFSEEYANSIIPRMCSGGGGNGIKVLNPGEFFDKNGKNAIVDNYLIEETSEPYRKIDKYPILYVRFMKDGKEWDSSLTDKLFTFVRQYIGIKSPNYLDKDKVKLAKKSLCIVISPRFIPIPSQISLYTKTVYIEPVSDREIEEIIYSSIIDEGIKPQCIVEREDLLAQMKISFRGMSALKIKQLIRQMIKCQFIGDNVIIESEVTAAIQDAKKELLNSCLGLKWEAIKDEEAVGLSNVVDWLNKHAPLFEDPEKANRQHVEIPKGILITGIPGSGKSLMAMTAARLLNNMPLISLNMGMLRGGIVGESEHNLENALRTAESMAPCVLWIDEIEKAMSGSSGDGSGDSGVGQRMFGTFLTWLQEKSSACFVFATSNDITRLPPELFRSERFDRKYFTFMPKAEECAKIFVGIINKQNEKYDKELRGYDKQLRRQMPKRLFDANLSDINVWIDVLNKCCTATPNDSIVNDDKENGRYMWPGNKKPYNKLLSGADISYIIKEAKFNANPKNQDINNRSCIYEKDLFLEIVKDIIKDFKPYGETNLINLAKSFYTLNKNQVESASESCILDFSHFNEDELRYEPSGIIECKYIENGNDKGTNLYDKILFNTLVGAINHYLPILEKKGQLI